MEKEQIYEVIQKLTGEITPYADSAIDHKRKENMETFLEVFDMMHTAIDDIAYNYKDSRYASAKNIGVMADNFLTRIMRE